MATLPCFVDTTSCGSPPSTGTTQAAASTGTQSSLLQHSFGYQLCAGAGVGQLPARIEPTIKAHGKFFIVDTATSSSQHRCTRHGARASYIHMRWDSLLRQSVT